MQSRPPRSTATDETRATHDALGLLAGDQTLFDELSPPVRAMAGALDTGLGLASGLGMDLSKAGADLVASLAEDIAGNLGSAVTDIVGAVGEAVPIVGGLLSILGSLFDLHGVDWQAECQALFQTYPPTGSGSAWGGGTTVPADVFASEHAVQGAAGWVSTGVATMVPIGPAFCRSALGMAWMQLIEGAVIDPLDLDLAKVHAAILAQGISDAELARIPTPAAVGLLWKSSIDRDLQMAPRQYAAQNPSAAHVGLPLLWRNRLLKLRRAIQAAKRVQGERAERSDGGAAFEMLRMDLVARAFARGYLTPDFGTYLFARQMGPELDGIGFATPRYAIQPEWLQPIMGAALPRVAAQHVIDKLFNHYTDADLLGDSQLVAAPATWIWGGDPCPSMVMGMLMQQVTTWQDSVHPLYSEGQQSVVEMEATAREAARKAVGRASGGPSRGSSLRPLPATAAPPQAAASVGDGPGLVGVGVGLGLVVGLIAWLGRRRPPRLPAARYRRWP